MNSQVLAIQSGDRRAGVEVTLTRGPLDPASLNDKWYQNGDDIILSKINDFALEISGMYCYNTGIDIFPFANHP